MAHEREIILQEGPWKTNSASLGLVIIHGTLMEIWGVPRRAQFQARGPSTAFSRVGGTLASTNNTASATR